MKEVQKRVFDKERFKGVPYNFEKKYEEVIDDMSPISQYMTFNFAPPSKG